MKKKAGPTSTGKRKTKPTPVWLDEEQIVWLKAQSNGVSGTVRNLVFEAMNLANLARSLKKSKKPKIKTSKKA